MKQWSITRSLIMMMFFAPLNFSVAQDNSEDELNYQTLQRGGIFDSQYKAGSLYKNADKEVYMKNGVSKLDAAESDSQTISADLTEKLVSTQKALAAEQPFPFVDQSTRAQDDFYRHVNGKWLDTFVMPDDKTSFGAFIELKEKTDDDLKDIMHELLTAKNLDPDAQRIVDLYNSYVDTSPIEKLGLSPIQGLLEGIQKIDSKEALVQQMASLHWLGVSMPVGIGVGIDDKVENAYVLKVFQSGLGMPNRDYYLKDDETNQAYQKAYKNYIGELFSLAHDATENPSQVIYDIEHQIAQNHWERAAMRDRNATYNKVSMDELDAKYSKHFPWRDFLKGSKCGDIKDLVLTTPSYFKAFDKLFNSVSLEQWKTYLTFRVLNTFASYLPAPFEQAKFEFFGKTLSGLVAQEPREKRALRMIDGTLGELMGKIYSAKFFPPKAKESMLEMLDNVKIAFREGIEQNTWMAPQTKEKALEKLNKMNLKIGYPDKFRTYDDVVIKADRLIENVLSSNASESKRDIEKLGKPVDRDEWLMLPHTINAYNMPVLNEICFPAAILQKPFFELDATDAQNYGAIGAVIGHEISHGFDDQGRKYDARGQLQDWWTEEDAKEFEARTSKLVAQYNSYEPIEGVNVNGELTLGENIADLTGLRMAYRAYQIANEKNPEKAPEGLTSGQTLFMSWGNVWRTDYREDALRSRLLTDPHSPGEYRCNGIVSNLEPFYKDFDVKEKDDMYLEESKRVKLWF